MKQGKQIALVNTGTDDPLRPSSIKGGDRLFKNKNLTSTSLDNQRSYRVSENNKNVEFSDKVELLDEKGGFVEMVDKDDQQVEEPRKVRLQGLMKPEVANLLDINAHFKPFDYREAAIQKEKEEM